MSQSLKTLVTPTLYGEYFKLWVPKMDNLAGDIAVSQT